MSTNSTLSINNLNATSTTLLTTKQINLAFSNPFLNTANRISLKYDSTKLILMHQEIYQVLMELVDGQHQGQTYITILGLLV